MATDGADVDGISEDAGTAEPGHGAPDSGAGTADSTATGETGLESGDPTTADPGPSGDGSADPNPTDAYGVPLHPLPQTMWRWVDVSPARKAAVDAYRSTCDDIGTKLNAQLMQDFGGDLASLTGALATSLVSTTPVVLPDPNAPMPKSDADVAAACQAYAAAQQQLITALGGAVAKGGILAVPSAQNLQVSLLYDAAFDDTVDRFDLKDNTVTITDVLYPNLQNIAFDYFLSIGKNLLVTSGLRTPAEQAAQMFVKAGEPGALSGYLNHAAAAQIFKAYTDGEAGKESDDQIQADMAAVITAQVAAGIFVSKHLDSLAFDVRLAGTDMAALTEAAGSSQFTANDHEQNGPPHIHLQHQ